MTETIKKQKNIIAGLNHQSSDCNGTTKMFHFDKRGVGKNDIVNNLVKEISENHTKIIDDFVKAYLASRWEDYFSKQKKIDFRRLELIIKQDGMTMTYFCRIRSGKINKLKQ